MQFPAVDEVENLHHHESIKDEREVPRVNMMFIKESRVVRTTIDVIEPTRSHSASNNTIGILILWMI